MCTDVDITLHRNQYNIGMASITSKTIPVCIPIASIDYQCLYDIDIVSMPIWYGHHVDIIRYSYLASISMPYQYCIDSKTISILHQYHLEEIARASNLSPFLSRSLDLNLFLDLSRSLKRERETERLQDSY